MKITTLQELKNMSQYDVIELPRFKTEIPFIAKVKRVSLLNLVKKGIIPNRLLSAAEELFYGKQNSADSVDLVELTNVMFIMAENALVEPSIKDLENAELQLTDEQIVALFNYTQRGVQEMESFRKESEDTEYNSNKQSI